MFCFYCGRTQILAQPETGLCDDCIIILSVDFEDEELEDRLEQFEDWYEEAYG